jgi:1-acyl-sn-glycerol-3-phosphate acyltransferase
MDEHRVAGRDATPGGDAAGSRPQDRGDVAPGSPLVCEPPALREILRWPLPHQTAVNASVIRGLCWLARRHVTTIRGLEHVAPSQDPFVLALNHSTRIESLLVPALLVLWRDGRLIHFLADWNFRLIPGVGLIYRRAKTVTVTRKAARPDVLNVLKPLYEHALPALDRTRGLLAAGQSVGIFPEGRVNRDPRRLMPGRKGAAYLSLAAGVPVVPVGIRFPAARDGRPISHRDAMEIDIGAPLSPPCLTPRMALSDLHAWHAVVMTEIGRRSGKLWPANQEERPS